MAVCLVTGGNYHYSGICDFSAITHYTLECFAIYGNKDVFIAVYIICVGNSFSNVAYNQHDILTFKVVGKRLQEPHNMKPHNLMQLKCILMHTLRNAF